ncbi:glycosyltransferase [Kiloniella sp. EL199]|uniref:glycosyltransferase n=1 Tax=Kiloniella sp. EL199 TaxID=2107581 RepID=UPI002110A36E|nr:glycosyltransferase [Kiloniella sp. EL199]
MRKATTLKFIVILPNLKIGGAQRVAVNLMNRLAEDSIKVTLVVIQEDDNEIRDLNENIKIIRLKKPRLLYALLPLLMTIKKLEGDYVLSTLGYVNLAILFMSHFFSSKVIVREANLLSVLIDNSKYPWLKRFLYNLLYKRADKVFVTSKRMKKEFEDRLNTPKDSLTLFYNPVDDRKIREYSFKSNNFIKSSKILAVLSGRFVEQKGFDRFIEIIPLIKKDISFLFIGDGPEETSLKSRVDELSENNRVHFLKNTDNPWTYYRLADCFLMPSRWEGMPNALLEALCCGTPCIATKESGGVQDIKDLLEDQNQLQIASFGDDFITKVNAIQPKEKNLAQLNSIPKEFTLEYAYSHFLKSLKHPNSRWI